MREGIKIKGLKTNGHFNALNEKLMERYKLLGSAFLSRLQKHREKQYFLASSDAFNFITKDYATQQISAL